MQMKLSEIETWPTFLRWILFFPISILSFVILYFIFLLGESRFPGSIFFFHIILQSVGRPLTAYIGVYIAPKAKRTIGYLYVIIYLFDFISNIIRAINEEILFDPKVLGNSIGILLGATITFYLIKTLPINTRNNVNGSPSDDAVENQDKFGDFEYEDLDKMVSEGIIDQYEAEKIYRKRIISSLADRGEFLINHVQIDWDKSKTNIENWRNSNKSNINNDQFHILFFQLDRTTQLDVIYWHQRIKNKIPPDFRYEIISPEDNFRFKMPRIIQEANSKNKLRFKPTNIAFNVNNFEDEVQVRYFNPYFFGLHFCIKIFYIGMYIPLENNLIGILKILSDKYGPEYSELYWFIHNYLTEAMETAKMENTNSYNQYLMKNRELEAIENPYESLLTRTFLIRNNVQYYSLLLPTSKLFDIPFEFYFKQDLFDRSTSLIERFQQIVNSS